MKGMLLKLTRVVWTSNCFKVETPFRNILENGSTITLPHGCKKVCARWYQETLLSCLQLPHWILAAAQLVPAKLLSPLGAPSKELTMQPLLVCLLPGLTVKSAAQTGKTKPCKIPAIDV